MPAVTVEDVLVLPRIVASSTGASRPVRRVVTSRQLMEGAGVLLSRPLPGPISMDATTGVRERRGPLPRS